ncbi:MAG: CsiV family protein [Steroidobacteraceae bacterium]
MTSQPSLVRRLAMGALLPALCLVALPALPQNAAPRYTVEIIVFRTSATTGALGAGSAVSGSGDVTATLLESGKLGGAAARLRAAGGYRVLGHATWSQGAAGFNSRRGVSASQLGLGAGVEGKIILERGQYLHFGVDLTIDDGGQRYRINEVRRVKSDEIQYFDHPAVGVIAVVSGGN